MGTQDENNMAEPQNEFLSGFKLKNRMESRKDDTQKPVFNQAEKNDRSIKCLLCPHYCNLSEGQIGICKTRYNK